MHTIANTDYSQTVLMRNQAIIATHAEQLLPNVTRACETLVAGLLNNHKTLCAEYPRHTGLASWFCGWMVNGSSLERPALPAINFNQDQAHFHLDHPQQISEDYDKKLALFGQTGDVLMLFEDRCPALPGVQHHYPFSTVIASAHNKGIPIILFTHHREDHIASFLSQEDVALCVAATHPLQVRMVHHCLIQALCELIEYHLFGYGEFS